MKKIFFGLLLVASVSQARVGLEHAELCAFNATEDRDAADRLFHTKSVDVITVQSISAFHLSLVNDYLMTIMEFRRPMPLKEIQRDVNELYLNILSSKKT